MTYSIAQSRQALEHALSAYEQSHFNGEVAGQRNTIVEAARAGIMTLGWLERHQDLMREINRLNIERPELAALFKTFPGAQITDIRDAK